MGKKKKNKASRIPGMGEIRQKQEERAQQAAAAEAEAGEETAEEPPRYRDTPRAEDEVKQLRNRLNRMTGQLNGIGRMLDEGRYCGDILTQVAAVESALQNFGYIVLRDHLDTCVTEEVRKGNSGIMDETVELIRKLK